MTQILITDLEKINLSAISIIVQTENGQVNILPNHCTIMCYGKILKYKNTDADWQDFNQNLDQEYMCFFEQNVLKIL